MKLLLIGIVTCLTVPFEHLQQELQENHLQQQLQETNGFNFLSQVPAFQLEKRQVDQKVARPIPGEAKQLETVAKNEDVDSIDEDFQSFVDAEELDSLN